MPNSQCTMHNAHLLRFNILSLLLSLYDVPNKNIPNENCKKIDDMNSTTTPTNTTAPTHVTQKNGHQNGSLSLFLKIRNISTEM